MLTSWWTQARLRQASLGRVSLRQSRAQQAHLQPMYAQLTRRAVPLNQQSRVSLQQMRRAVPQRQQTQTNTQRAHLQQSQAHLQQANTQLTACSFFTRGALPTPTINSSCQITEFSTNSVFSHQDTIISSSISMDTARASQSVRIFGKTTVPHRN